MIDLSVPLSKDLIDKVEVQHRLRVLFDAWHRAFDSGDPRLATKLIRRYFELKRIHHTTLYGRLFDDAQHYRPRRSADVRAPREQA